MDGRFKIDINQLHPHGTEGTVATLALKVDRLLRDHTSEFDRIIHQYDQIINRPNADPDVVMRALEQKTRILNNISDNSTRIALSIERERRVTEEKNRTLALNKSSAVRLLDHQLRVQRGIHAEIDPSLAHKPTKVRMYDLGTKFIATVGVGAYDRNFDFPEPP